MVAKSIILPVAEDGRVSISDQHRRSMDIEPGDHVQIVVLSSAKSAAELAGSFPLKPGVVPDDDFGNLIREAMDDWADRKMARLKESSE